MPGEYSLFSKNRYQMFHFNDLLISGETTMPMTNLTGDHVYDTSTKQWVLNPYKYDVKYLFQPEYPENNFSTNGAITDPPGDFVNAIATLDAQVPDYFKQAFPVGADHSSLAFADPPNSISPALKESNQQQAYAALAAAVGAKSNESVAIALCNTLYNLLDSILQDNDADKRKQYEQLFAEHKQSLAEYYATCGV